MVSSQRSLLLKLLKVTRLVRTQVPVGGLVFDALLKMVLRTMPPVTLLAEAAKRPVRLALVSGTYSMVFECSVGEPVPASQWTTTASSGQLPMAGPRPASRSTLLVTIALDPRRCSAFM